MIKKIVILISFFVSLGLVVYSSLFQERDENFHRKTAHSAMQTELSGIFHKIETYRANKGQYPQNLEDMPAYVPTTEMKIEYKVEGETFMVMAHLKQYGMSINEKMEIEALPEETPQ